MNDIQVYNNPDFGQIRTLTIDGEPWFVGKDVAQVLGYSNTRDALNRHIDDEDKRVSGITTPSGVQEMTIINESGLYSLILSSKLPGAKKFKHWVTSEVLPSIRKTGNFFGGSKELQAIFMLDNRTMEHEQRITALEGSMVIDYAQQRTLTILVNEVVVEALGGRESTAYKNKNVRSKAYCECNRDIQYWFQVNSRNNIPKKRFKDAVEYIQLWQPSTNLRITIRRINERKIESVF